MKCKLFFLLSLLLLSILLAFPLATYAADSYNFENQEYQQESFLDENDDNETYYEILMTLKSIEYQLKIISGGIVLAVISAFIWFTMLKPIKQFTRI